MKFFAGKGCLLSRNRLSSLFKIGECENLNELLEVVRVAQLEECLKAQSVVLLSRCV